MNISVPEQMRDWVQQQTNDEKYASSSDYVRDLIRKDQERSQLLQAFQDAVTEGLNSGEAKTFDTAAFKQKMAAEVRRE